MQFIFFIKDKKYVICLFICFDSKEKIVVNIYLFHVFRSQPRINRVTNTLVYSQKMQDDRIDK